MVKGNKLKVIGSIKWRSLIHKMRASLYVWSTFWFVFLVPSKIYEVILQEKKKNT